jgi:Flagellar transcriptional activator (FlhD)
MNQRDEVVDSIHELNLAWLRLARLIAQGDVRHASETLGVAPPVVGLLARSTDSRLAELAAIPHNYSVHSGSRAKSSWPAWDPMRLRIRIR